MIVSEPSPPQIDPAEPRPDRDMTTTKKRALSGTFAPTLGAKRRPAALDPAGGWLADDSEPPQDSRSNSEQVEIAQPSR